MAAPVHRRATLGAHAPVTLIGDAVAQTGTDPLPSWREGPRKRAQLDVCLDAGRLAACLPVTWDGARKEGA
jgi:hypothetical protein